MRSSKIPKGTWGLVYQRRVMNLYKLVGIRLDDISKQRFMHEHVGKRAKMQRSKESQMGGTKLARQA